MLVTYDQILKLERNYIASDPPNPSALLMEICLQGEGAQARARAPHR